MNTVLKDTSLCAIVRDEMFNPAGGVEDFIACTLPFVKEGVVLDTGSKDRTFSTLKKLQKKFKNLRVYSKEMPGYASPRNYAMAKVDTKRVLILDADERLTPIDFEVIDEYMQKFPAEGYEFQIDAVYPNGTLVYQSGVHAVRLFNLAKDLRFQPNFTGVYEVLRKGTDSFKPEAGKEKLRVTIKHFRPNETSLISKSNYYRHLSHAIIRKRDGLKTEIPVQSESPGFINFKRYNKYREQLERLPVVFGSPEDKIRLS